MAECLEHTLSYIMVLLLFTCAHTQDVRCPSNWPLLEKRFSCSTLKSNTHNLSELSVNHCVFEKNNYASTDFPKLLCNFTILVTHTNTAVKVVNKYLAVSLSMKVLCKESHNATVLCVGMTSMTVHKTEPPVDEWYTVRDSNIVWYVAGVSELAVTVDFHDPVPVGLVQVQDVQCWEKGWSISCIQDISLSTLLRSEFADNWKELSFLQSLHGQVPNLTIVFNEYNQVSSQWLLSNFTGLGLQQLTLNNGNLQGYLPLSQQDLLVYLDLSHNEIARIPEEKFFFIPNLEYLNIANNKLVKIPSGISTLSKLRILDLSGNPFYIIGDNNFISPLQTLNNLKILHISHTGVHSLSILQPLLLTSSAKLLELYLKDCDISVIKQEDIYLFHGQTDLCLLDISSNNLQEITSDLTELPQSLKILNFSSNILSKSPQLKLRDGNTLSILDLSKNKLTTPNAVESGTVHALDLSGNNIATWNTKEFLSPFVHIKCLNLSYNFLKVLTIDMLKTLQPVVKTLSHNGMNYTMLRWVDLGGNSFDCKDCKILHLKEYLTEENSHNILNLNTNLSLTCNQYTTPIEDLELEDCLVERTSSENTITLTVIPLASVFALILLLMVAMYVYNFEITYLLRLVKLKRHPTTQEEYQYDAFVCYSGSDRAWVISVLLPRLENGPEKYKLCLHDRDFILGSFITHNIVNSMQQSRKTLVILTSNFVHSQWCNWELEMAKHKLFEDGKDFLILLELERLGRASLPRHLRYLMETRTYLEWSEERQEDDVAWRRLMEALGTSLHMQYHSTQQ